jgi:DNA polymerase I
LELYLDTVKLKKVSYTEESLLAELTAICNANHINVEVDPTNFSINSPAAIDVEHDEEGNLVGIGLYDGMSSYYFTSMTECLDIELQNLDLIAHNGKGDFECLRQWGALVSDKQLIWDTELIAHIIDSSRKGYGLKKLSSADLGIEYPDYQDIVGKRTAKVRRTLDRWPVEIVSKYNALDTYTTYRLYELQAKVLSDTSKTYFNTLEKSVSYVFQAMETRGIRVDLNYLKTLKNDLEIQKAPIEREIKNELGPINLNSPKQLLEALNAKGLYPTLKTKASTDKRALAQLSSPIVSNLLAYSELDTLLSSFVYPYLERNQEVVHPFFNQCGTRTGRPSCSNPNLLQIPRRTTNGKLVRRMFIPRDGMSMGDCDFGQIEPRVMAHLSKDPVLCQMFNDGVDFHEFTAQRLGISRDRAKILNLSVGYRATFKSVQNQLGGTHEEAQEQIDKWWNLFPTLRRWQDLLIYNSKRSGFCTTLMGRRIKVDGLTEGNAWKREAAERQLINNITQGSAAEIMKMAMIKIAKGYPNIGLLVQVYDELLFEEDKSSMVDCMNFVRISMQNAIKLDVPLTVDCKIGEDWASCH